MTPRLQRIAARLRGERGYTVVELITALSVFILVLTGITTLFVRATTAEAQMNSRSQAQQAARVGLDRFRKEAHCASASSQTGPNDVTLIMPPQCPFGQNVTYCIYRPAGVTVDRWTLYRELGDTCDATGSTRIAQFLTTATNPPSKFTSIAAAPGALAQVKVDLHVNQKPSKPLDSYDLVDTIVLRNSVRG